MTTLRTNMGLYTATKGAVDQMVRVVAKEVAESGVCVNAVAPGPVATELLLQGRSEEQLPFLKDANPFKDIAVLGQIADAILMLASGSASWVAGQKLRVNGALA